MTAQRAAWQLAEAMDSANPIAQVVYSTGIEIDLTASEEDLAQVFIKLLNREGRYLHAGITCELKDNGQDCLHCPMATLEDSEPLSRLCRLGKDESTVEKRYIALNEARMGPIRELAALASECGEIGGIPPELADLLTEAGP